MKTFQDHDHWLFLVWLVVTGFILFGVTVCWNEGLILLLFEADRSHLCLVIGALYLAGSAHCARRALFLSRETDHVRALGDHIGSGSAQVRTSPGAGVFVGDYRPPADSVLADHLEMLARRGRGEELLPSDGEQATLIGALVARAKGSHDIGWFMVDILVKLGLLGTIVGFILMLGSVADTASLDVNTMQKVLKQMSNGMGTALYTTLAGLVGSMALGLQYLLLDKGADDLIERIVRLTESRLTLT